jgi:CheY-like chemotaxis protein/Tfp pilus assembly protein PilZ
MTHALAPATGTESITAESAAPEATTTQSNTPGPNAAGSTKTGSRESSNTTLGVRALLVSGDIQTIDTLCESMGKMAMHVEVCSDFVSATRKLCHSKFEALIVDFKERAEALELLKTSRQMTSHKACIVLAILNSNDEMPSAFRAGASFVLVKPLSPTVLMRTLRVSYPLMVSERRRSFRCPVQIPVHVAIGSKPEFIATSANISEVGIALTNAPGLQVGDRVALRLTLPLTHAAVAISAEVCWCNPAGASGMEFIQVSASVKEQLRSWLAARLEEFLPEGSATLKR